MSVTVLVGTDKGGFLLRADRARRDWTIDGPLFKGWKVTASMREPGATTPILVCCPATRSLLVLGVLVRPAPSL